MVIGKEVNIMFCECPGLSKMPVKKPRPDLARTGE